MELQVNKVTLVNLQAAVARTLPGDTGVNPGVLMYTPSLVATQCMCSVICPSVGSTCAPPTAGPTMTVANCTTQGCAPSQMCDTRDEN